MVCPECGASVPPLRLFCPQCGAPTDADMRDRRAGRASPPADDQLIRNRKRVLMIGGGLLLTLAVMTKGNWIDFDSDDGRRGAVEMSAEEIYDAYRDDPEGAARRFDAREMVVKGEFLRIVPDGSGNPDLRLKTGNADQPLGADLVQVAHGAAAQLKPGQIVTVSCQRITGSAQDRWLQNCAIQDVEEGNASPTALPPAAPPTPESTAEAEGNGA